MSKRDVFMMACIGVAIITIFGCAIGSVCYIQMDKVSSIERAHNKETCFQHKFSALGVELLNVEGDVASQVCIARKFFTKRYGETYVYDIGDYKCLVDEVTNGKYTVNMFGYYVIDKRN